MNITSIVEGKEISSCRRRNSRVFSGDANESVDFNRNAGGEGEQEGDGIVR
jgi:hypothetical protein